MEHKTDYSEQYNTLLRRILRGIRWLLVSSSVLIMFIADSPDSSYIFIFLIVTFLWNLLIIQCYTCPKCCEIVRVPLHPNHPGENPFGAWTIVGLDGKCWNCGAVLKKNKKNIKGGIND